MATEASATASAASSQRKFGPKWEVKYAVAVTERDRATQLPTKAVCLMCQAFEREEAVGAKRKKSSRVRSFSTPWRPDNMKRHMEQQHPTRWDEYQKLADGDKRSYFASLRGSQENAVTSLHGTGPTMVGGAMPSTEGSALAAQSRAYLIDRDIVEEIIGGVLSLGSNEEYRNAWNVPVTFTRLGEVCSDSVNAENDLNESSYVARVDSLLRFNMCLKYVAMGISFGQIVPLFQNTAEETGMDTALRSAAFTEQQLACLCRLACAVNLQTLKDALRGVWGFAISLERGNDAGSPYLDVRVRFERDGKLHDFHLVSVPIHEDSSQTIELQCEVLTKCLTVVAPSWTTQLLGISTSEPIAKMPATARVLLSRLSSDCVASLFCEWEFVQQFEQGVQEAFNMLCNERFISALTVLTGHFRRQLPLIREMKGELCPKFEEGQWQSIAKVLKWLADNRARLTKVVQDTQPPGAPGKEWWITVLAVNSVMDRVNVALVSLRGPAAGPGQARRDHLSKLVTDLALVTGALGPLAGPQRVVNQTELYAVGDFSLSRDATLSFLKEQGSFAINAVNELVANFPTCCQAALESTANFALFIMARTHQLVSDCDDSGSLPANVAASVAPFLPQALCKMRNQAFVAHVQTQRVRLLHYFTADQIEQIEDQHRTLRTAYQVDENVSQQLNALVTTSSFREAWKDGRLGGIDCRLLRKFCGAIACAATHPFVLRRSTASEFSLINWRRSPFGLSLVDFLLEAALHSRQYASLSLLREC